MLSSIQQNSVRVPIPPSFLGIFRDLMITFWNYVITRLNSSEKQIRHETKAENLMEYIEFSDINSICETLSEIISENRKEIFEDNNLIQLFTEENFNSNKNDLFRLCEYSLRLQEKSKIEFDKRNNITVTLGAQTKDFEEITITFNDLTSYEKNKKEETFHVTIKSLNLSMEYEALIPDRCRLGDFFQRVRYEFGRGYAMEKFRGKQNYGGIQLRIYADEKCEKLIYEMPVFIRAIQELVRAKSGGREAGIYILMNEVYEGNHEILNRFFGKELENLKGYISEITSVVSKGNTRESPIIYDLLQEFLLLKIVYEFLGGSIAYVYNWPSLRIYYLPPKLQRGFIVIDMPPSLIEIANLAVISSAKKLNMSSRKLLTTIFKLVTKMNKEGTQSGISINDLYVLIHTVLQGNPDIDLFYELERASCLVEEEKNE